MLKINPIFDKNLALSSISLTGINIISSTSVISEESPKESISSIGSCCKGL